MTGWIVISKNGKLSQTFQKSKLQKIPFNIFAKMSPTIERERPHFFDKKLKGLSRIGIL